MTPHQYQHHGSDGDQHDDPKVMSLHDVFPAIVVSAVYGVTPRRACKTLQESPARFSGVGIL